jgi:hypothetical protein
LSEVTSILAELAKIYPKYSWYGGNCFWFAGSVWASLAEKASVQIKTPYYEKKGKFAGVRVGYDYNVRFLTYS